MCVYNPTYCESPLHSSAFCRAQLLCLLLHLRPNHQAAGDTNFHLVLSLLLYNSSLLVCFISLFSKAYYLFLPKVAHNSLILKSILPLFSTPPDTHQKPAGSFNKSQVGAFVTDKIPERHQPCVMGSWILIGNWRSSMLCDAWPKCLIHIKI